MLGQTDTVIMVLPKLWPRRENLWVSRILEVRQLADRYRVARCETPVAPGFITCPKFWAQSKRGRGPFSGVTSLLLRCYSGDPGAQLGFSSPQLASFFLRSQFVFPSPVCLLLVRQPGTDRSFLLFGIRRRLAPVVAFEVQHSRLFPGQYDRVLRRACVNAHAFA